MKLLTIIEATKVQEGSNDSYYAYHNAAEKWAKDTGQPKEKFAYAGVDVQDKYIEPEMKKYGLVPDSYMGAGATKYRRENTEEGFPDYKMMTRGHDHNDKTCPVCKGSGNEKSYDELNNKPGHVYIQKPKPKCPRCDGTGKKIEEGEERSIIADACVEKLVDKFRGEEHQFENLGDLEYAIYSELEQLDVEDCVDPDMEHGGQRMGDFASGGVLNVIDSGSVIDTVIADLDTSEIEEGITTRHSYDPVKPGGQSSPRKPVPVKGQKISVDGVKYIVTHVSNDRTKFDVVNANDPKERHIDISVENNPFFIEGKSPHKKGSAKYKKHMAAMHAEAKDPDKTSADQIIKQIIQGYGIDNLEDVFRQYYPQLSDEQVERFISKHRKPDLRLIRREDVELNDDMIGEPDNFYDAEQRQEAHKDLQNALQGNYLDDYIIDGDCPACGGSGYMDGEETFTNDDGEEEESSECDGFGNYGCDQGQMTYGSDGPSWVEIMRHDKRQADRKDAVANYPGDEKVISQIANMVRGMEDPRMAMQQMAVDYPQMGRRQRAELVSKGLKKAGLTNEGQRCWKGYEKKGTKKMFGKTVNNCVKKEGVDMENEGRIEDTFGTKTIDKHDKPEKNKAKKEESIQVGDELMIETAEGEGIVVPVLHVVGENILVGWDNLAEDIVVEGARQLEELRKLAGIDEAEYQGRKVKLGKPTRGDVKKFKVYVKDPKTGNVKKVNFGHGGSSAKKAGQKTMKIKKSNPARRKSFRARHNCDNPGPRTKARYWSCRAW